MKKSELGIIAVIIVISIGIAYFVGNAVLGSTTQKGENVQYEEKITSDITQPDSSIFYDGAKNPTVQIAIGDSSNLQPLSGGQ